MILLSFFFGLQSTMYVPKDFYRVQGMYEHVPQDMYASWRNTAAVARPRRVLSLLTIALPFAIFWLLLSQDRLPSFLSKGPACTTATTHWHGWANVENLIVLYATSPSIFPAKTNIKLLTV